MKHEFHAEYCLHARPRHVQQGGIDFLSAKSRRAPDEWGELAMVQDPWARRMLLAQTQAPPTPYKNYARVGTRKERGGMLESIRQGIWKQFFKERMKQLQALALTSSLDDLATDLGIFPQGTFAVRLTFRLSSPYISRDDVAWDVWDNPIRKEWVFKVPYVAPGQWKGALRAAMRRARGYTTWEEEAKDDQMVHLFGNVKGKEVDFSAGRLHFYPTYFDRLGLEVINPHDRKTGAGKQPIYFECVPAGAEGIFALLYIPFDLIGRPHDEILRQAEADLKRITEAVEAMMRTYGFGAKTSSGYGTAEDNVSGMIRTGAGVWPITHLSQLTEEVSDVEF